eukprot:Phypoly_transcript_08944.p1 GENE.Phypoly_transcript_08944~~Phypoly_transcript_08944.p1  ORF type:complete len:471 (+),score=83.81 Phypoly_transcript_08944:184-1413(+)
MAGKILCAVLLCLCIFLFAAEAKVAKQHVKAHEFAYLNKFCFGLGNGTLNYTITSKADTTNLVLLFIDDQDGNWTDVYKKHLTCEQKREKAIDPLPVVNGSRVVVGFSDVRRPHYWYVSALNCGGDIDLEYDFVFLQESTSKWVRQFSHDDQGLEGLYLFYFLFFLFGLVVHGYTVWTFMQTNSYHLIVRLFTFCVATEFLSIFCLFIHYAAYSSNGHGVPFFHGLGDFLDIVAQIGFILLVVLIAKGWCISKTIIDDRFIVLVGLGVLSVLYLAMFIWMKAGLDPASTLYVYETAPGIILIVARAICMVWFAYSMRNTYLEENNAAKRQFYLYFGIAYLVWFLILPFITIVATGLDPWVRQKTVMIMYVTFNTLFLVLFGFLLWPSRAGEYFQLSAQGGIGSVPYDAI